MGTVSGPARLEIVAAVRARYRGSARPEKERILSEFVALTGYHRKHAIRVLNQDAKTQVPVTALHRRVYDEAVKSALVVIWETADRICSKRLKAVMSVFITSMEKRGHLDLADEVRERLLKVSAATIDRILAPVRETASTRRKRRSPRKVKAEVPIKTYSDWEDPSPGSLEIDFVVHGGGSMAGEYLHSFAATDVCSGWVEAVALLAREQSLVIEGLERMNGQFPIPIRGIDSDNDGAFINETLVAYCRDKGIAFTRSRVHQKNDQAWIEQKNGAVIRRMVGHERLSGIVAGQALAQLFQVMRLYVNFFQPSFKLQARTRESGRIKRSYHPAATPCERLLAHPEVSESVKEKLKQTRDRLDPVELLQRIRQGQSALAALSKGEPCEGPTRESLDQFLATLPELWRRGEVRPTHRKEPAKERYWRTREDPFRKVWTDILLWLQSEPDIIAKTVLERLNAKHPGQFDPGVLRTLQRRIGEWRLTMARQLIFGGHDEPTNVEPPAGPKQPIQGF